MTIKIKLGFADTFRDARQCLQDVSSSLHAGKAALLPDLELVAEEGPVQALRQGGRTP